MVANHQGTRDQAGVIQACKVVAFDARNCVIDGMSESGHERRIRANAPAAARPRTADPAAGQGGYRDAIDRATTVPPTGPVEPLAEAEPTPAAAAPRTPLRLRFFL